MVPVAPGKHRRLEAEPFSTGEFLASPVDTTGPDWGPGNGVAPGPQPSDIAGTPAVSTLPARVDPDWPPDLGGSMLWPQWDAPPPDLPSDHPSAPVPRVRAPLASGGTGPRRGGNPGARPAQPGPDAGAPRLPQRQPGRQPNPASGRPSGRAQGYDTGQYPAQTGRPARQGPRPGGRPQGYGPANARPQGFGPGPANGGPQSYGPGPVNAAAQGYALAQGYAPEPDYVPDQSQLHGARRLYAVPDETNPDGHALPRQPGYDDGAQAAAIIRQQALDEAAAIRQAAEKDAASIRQQATALREAAEQEAARMRAVITSLSGQLSQMSAYATENLASPGGAPAALAAAATAALVAAPPAALPAGPATRPARPATRPDRPARPARPVTQPDKSTARPTTGTRGRQALAARKMVALLAALATVGVVSGAAELVLHGGPFFIFRANGAGASETGPVENQGPGQPDAPGAHHVPVSGKHAK